MDAYISIFCTVPSKEIGITIADNLVKGGIAACVNIVPGVTSLYTWKGEFCTDSELLLIIKTREEKFELVRNKISELHPYEVPEIISFAIKNGNNAYLNWIDSCLK